MAAATRNKQNDDECIGLTLLPDPKVEYVKNEGATTTVENLDVSTSSKPTTQEINTERHTWNHKSEFLLAVIGYTVDLGNFWRFPLSVYKNGGGVFFIPYFLLLILIGLPLVYMELALGQYYRSGTLTIWKNICPLMKGIGWATILINFMIIIFYNTTITWAVYYMIVSFRGLYSELTWESCDNPWNTQCCVEGDMKGNIFPVKLPKLTNGSLASSNNYNKFLTIPESCSRLIYSTEEYFYRYFQIAHTVDPFNNLGRVNWELSIYLLIIFIIVYFTLWKSVKSLGKVVWVTTIAPYLILIILLIQGVRLPGSSVGIRYYILPKMKLLQSASIWNAAAIQVFYSVGPGFGVLLALSSYNKFRNNCYRDALQTSSISGVTSILFGFVVFSVVGCIATALNQTIEEIIEGKGPEIIFIIYPYVVALMKWSTLFNIIFFFMLITLGIGNTFGILESIITGLCDEFPSIFRRHRSLFVFGILLICYWFALLTCTNGGYYIIDFMNEIVGVPAILLIVLIECIAVSWFYGINRFSFDIKKMIGTRPFLFWRIIWCFISPMLLFMIFYNCMTNLFSNTIQIQSINLRDLPISAQRWSYLMVFVPILCVPIYAIYKLFVTPGRNFDERLQQAIKAEETSREHVHSPLNNDY